MRFRFDTKNFFIGFGAMLVCLILPVIGDMFIDLVAKIRDNLPWSKKK